MHTFRLLLEAGLTSLRATVEELELGDYHAETIGDLERDLERAQKLHPFESLKRLSLIPLYLDYDSDSYGTDSIHSDDESGPGIHVSPTTNAILSSSPLFARCKDTLERLELYFHHESNAVNLAEEHSFLQNLRTLYIEWAVECTRTGGSSVDYVLTLALACHKLSEVRVFRTFKTHPRRGKGYWLWVVRDGYGKVEKVVTESGETYAERYNEEYE